MCPEGSQRGRGRPRDPEAEAKVLTAALVEYGERGWSGFTMDGVARRAHVGKSTVYLRWHDKDALLTDAVASSGLVLTAVDTGTFEGDLVGLATNLLRHFHTPAGWAAIRITIDAASVHERLGAFAARVTELHGRQVEQICARAAERGEIDPDFPADLVTEAMYGATLSNALLERMEGRTDSDDYLRERAVHLARMVLRGCGSTSLRRGRALARCHLGGDGLDELASPSTCGSVERRETVSRTTLLRAHTTAAITRPVSARACSGDECI